MTDHLTLAMRGYDPTVRPPVLTDGDVSYVVEDTPVGRLLLAARADGTALASAFTPTDADVDRVLARRRELDSYLAGGLREFTVPVDLVLASPFQREVLPTLASTVGFGQRTTYGALAAATGRPTASRAVGAALGANPLCVVLPCHRVLAASGSLTGYAGGLAAKAHLLALEAG